MCGSLFTPFENKNSSYYGLKINSAESCKPIKLIYQVIPNNCKKKLTKQSLFPYKKNGIPLAWKIMERLQTQKRH